VSTSITTDRLVLIPATVALAQAEFDDLHRLGTLLGCDVPRDWPPPLNDSESMKWFVTYARKHPAAVGWTKWYFAERLPGDRLVLVGNGGFKGMPSGDGTVEVGYSILPAHQRRGFATEAVQALVAWAFAHKDVQRVIAHTYPELSASIGVLRKAGFTAIRQGETSEPGTMRFERRR
jgi:ribosomal-protein-alanine N-acetyltransferase